MFVAGLVFWFAIVVFPDGSSAVRGSDKPQTFQSEAECKKALVKDRADATKNHPEWVEGKDYVFVCVQNEDLEKKALASYS